MEYELRAIDRRRVPEVVQGEVVDLLRERDELGRDAYQESLTTWNGRRAMRDLLEELADAFQYAYQEAMERDDLEVELAALRAVARAADELLTCHCEPHARVLRQALRYWMVYARVPDDR